MEAASENELAHNLAQSGLELIDARAKKENAFLFSLSRNKISRRTLAGFCSRLHDLLRVGIAFPDALHDIRMSTDNRVLADALTQISQAIANGKGIAASFALFPDLFPPVFIAIAASGEKSGDMAVVFDYLARYAATNAQTHERLVRALRYPLFLFVIAGSAVAFMMAMVVPQIVQFLNGIEGHLPFSTRMLIFVSAVVTNHGRLLLSVVLISGFAFYIARKTSSSFAISFDGFLLRLPVLGSVIAKSEVARFAHSFSILLRSGCDVAGCLRQAGETISNRAMRDNVEKAEQRVLDGADVSQALDGVLPPFAIGVLRTGEQSGSLDKSLDDIVAAYDRESADAVDTFIGLLEPCLTLAIGGLLAWTVLAVLGPLYGSLSVLGGRM
jgi:type IV pilus assembly protein PilC